MVMDTVGIVFFAIQSAVRMGQQAREAYVDATRARAITLPLPDFNPSTSIDAAVAYFRSARLAGPLPPRVDELVTKVDTAGRYSVLTPDETRDLLAFHNEALLLEAHRRGAVNPADDGSFISNQALEALVRIRQWERGSDPNATALQRLAGTFLEIAVDYYVHDRGAAVLEGSSEGKVILAFLRGIDDFKFAVEPLTDLPKRLFLSLLEGLAVNADLLAGDKNTQDFVRATLSGLLNDVKVRLDAKPGTAATLRILDWAELVFRSVLDSGTRLVVEQPERFLGLDDGKADLVTQVGGAILGALLDQPEGRLERAFSRQSLDKVTKAALAVVAEHPDLVTDQGGLKAIIAGVATSLSDGTTILTVDIIPEVIRLVLEKTGENVELLWPKAADDADKHLVLTLAATTLRVISAPAAKNAPWSAAFTRADALVVVETVLAEFAANPSWLLSAVGGSSSNAEVALTAVVGVLRQKGGHALATATAREIVVAALRAVALRPQFLDPIGAGGDIGKPLVAAAVNAVLDFAYSGGAVSWRVMRRDTLAVMVEVTLAELAAVKLDEAKAVALRDELQRQATDILAGAPWSIDTFRAGLRTALK